VPIDVELARAQHREYEQALREAGYVVEHLESTNEMPDSVFVEDIAVVFDELAIITRPGAASRRIETRRWPARWRVTAHFTSSRRPASSMAATCSVAGKQVFVGLSTRTNDHAAVQMTRAAAAARLQAPRSRRA
jgi:dimethylargininase